MTKNYLEYIEELEKQLKESNDCLKSILYCPEQVNWSADPEAYKPQWLQVQIVNNERLLEAQND